MTETLKIPLHTDAGENWIEIELEEEYRIMLEKIKEEEENTIEQLGEAVSESIDIEAIVYSALHNTRQRQRSSE